MIFSLRKLFAIACLLTLGWQLPAQSLPKVKAAYRATPLKEVFQQLEKKHGISFSYEDALIAPIQITTKINRLDSFILLLFAKDSSQKHTAFSYSY